MKAYGNAAIRILILIVALHLKIFGEGEWLQNKHRTKAKRKSWRKLHLGFDLGSGEIVCVDLTKDGIGDTTALPDLLEQIDADVSKFIALYSLRWKAHQRSAR